MTEEKKIISIASYPKSGNTWMRLLIEAYAKGAVDINNVSVRMDDLPEYHWQRISPKPLNKLEPHEASYLRPAVYAHLIETSAPPRYVKTHSILGVANGVPTIPTGLIAQAIYMMRDPRDVVLSFAYHVDEPLDHVIDRLCDPNGALLKNEGLFHMLGAWPAHVHSWTTKPPFPVMVVRYEDLREDPAGNFTQVLRFLGVEPDKDRLEKAVWLTDFDHMQKTEAAMNEVGDKFREAPPSGKPFFRRGKVGAWKDELTDAQVARIEETCGEIMRKWGYDTVTDDAEDTDAQTAAAE